MKALFLTLLLSYSCTRYAEIDKTALGVTIHDVHMDIDQLTDIDWKIGKHKDATVSQSITFLIQMPRLREEDLEYIQKRTGANAWIVRVIQARGSQIQDLGSVYTLYRPKQVVRGVSGGPVTNISLKIYYASAYPSERFRHFKCPAFGHDKEISSLSIKGKELPMEINIGQPSPYGERPQLVQLTASSFNGGHDLAGDYYFEIAPYNSSKKEILGPFKRMARYIEVQEKRVDVGSCKGVRPELE